MLSGLNGNFRINTRRMFQLSPGLEQGILFANGEHVGSFTVRLGYYVKRKKSHAAFNIQPPFMDEWNRPGSNSIRK